MASEVIDKIMECLKKRQSFLLSGGAGSGKTYTLVETIKEVFSSKPVSSVACITYTNVAADEIKSRTSYKKLHVSTIHDFLWMIIKGFQKPLKDSFFALLEAEKQHEGTGIGYSGETELNKDSFDRIEYRNYRKLDDGIVSHDDIIKIASYLFSQYPLLSIIVCDKFDYIFVDEYQDTDKKVIEIFLKYMYKYSTKKGLCIGFFGDRMQSIYENRIGDIQDYVNNGLITKIIKEDNYRCSKKVIELINIIRNDDIKQKPSNKDESGNILNKEGRISFLYSLGTDFNLENIKNNKLFSEWDFNDPEQTKILFLTHRLIAKRYGFVELLDIYRSESYADNLTGNEPDVFASHLLRIGGVLYNFLNKRYNTIIKTVDFKITNHQKKVELSELLNSFSDSASNTIGEVIKHFNEAGVIKTDDRFNEFAKEHIDLVNKINSLDISQLKSYYEYYNDLSPYSTQHGVKGAEFDNVLVILDNDRWNNYNFQYYFEQTQGKESIIERTEKIFYVCCSRAKNNLVVYVYKPSAGFIKSAESLFGIENVYKI